MLEIIMVGASGRGEIPYRLATTPQFWGTVKAYMKGRYECGIRFMEVEPNLPRQGQLLLGATCAPTDITFPTDLSRVTRARKKLEQILEVLHAPVV